MSTEKIIIEPGRGNKNYWRDLWNYRDLFSVLAWRDVAVRYKQAVAGALWAILQPLASMIIMTIVFGKIAGLPSEGRAPYAMMVFVALLPWQFFSSLLTTASQSIVSNAHLITKVYFPRMIIPMSSVAVALVDFLVSALILIGLMIWYQFWPTWRILTLPVFILLAIVAVLGPSLILTALIVRYRDFRFLIPFIVQLGLYVSPVAYSSAIVHQKLGGPLFTFYTLNPMVGVIDGFRWALLGGEAVIWWPGFLISLAISCFLFILGITYFRKTERLFSDYI